VGFVPTILRLVQQLESFVGIGSLNLVHIERAALVMEFLR